MSGKLTRHDLKPIGPGLFEIEQGKRDFMRVPARLYVNEKLLDQVLVDQSLEQLVNTTFLPGIVRYALAMPDIHQGYGFPIGGVAATRLPDGAISPGGIGYDINCGVRLLASGLSRDQVKGRLDRLVEALFANVPSGLGRGGDLKLNRQELDEVLTKGARWVVEQGWGEPEDLEATEEEGRMADANPDAVSNKARQRGHDQVGTLGSGNHFVEVQVVDKVYEPTIAAAWGLFENQVVVLVHSGSRGLGHQVCTDYVQELQTAVKQLGLVLPDRELVCAPLSSPQGRAYYEAMCAAANYAWANRALLAEHVRQAFREVFKGNRDARLHQIYDVAHNIGKIETYVIDGKPTRVLVHRKGATRAFAAGTPALPPRFQQTGQPVLIPGSMGTASYVLVGTPMAMETTFGSTCHGAGRALSRAKAKHGVQAKEIIDRLGQQGTIVKGASREGIVEEAPEAYKDVDLVVDAVTAAGLARKVVRLRPLGVIKG